MRRRSKILRLWIAQSTFAFGEFGWGPGFFGPFVSSVSFKKPPGDW